MSWRGSETLIVGVVAIPLSRALSTVRFPIFHAADDADLLKIATNATRDHLISATAVTRLALAATTRHMYCHGSTHSVKFPSPGTRSGWFAICQTAREYWMLVKRSTFARPVIHERVHRLSCATHAMAVVQVATAEIINLRRLRDEE